jgi:hypothetical protein
MNKNRSPLKARPLRLPGQSVQEELYTFVIDKCGFHIFFPLWLIERMSDTWKRNSDLPWVLEPKALPSFIEHEPAMLSPSDVALASYHLSRYIRTAQLSH